MVALVLSAAAFPFDGRSAELAAWLRERLGGDPKRELEFIGQFGALTSILIVAACVWLLDPGRRAELVRLALAMVAASLGCLVLKMLIGRPRPKFGDPGVLLGPWGAYPIDADVGVRHAWEVWADISSDLWSMPSSHTAAAVALSAVLARWYRPLTPLVVTLASLVACSRILFGAHYPSDVLMGAAVGWIAARAVLGRPLIDQPAPPRPNAGQPDEREDRPHDGD